jgi:cell division protein FtsB
MLKPVLHAVQLFLKGATGKDRQAKHHLSEHLLRMQLAYDQLQADYSTLEQKYSRLQHKQTDLTQRLSRSKTDTDELLNIADSEVSALISENEDLQRRLRQSETEKTALQDKNGALLGTVAFLEQQLDLRSYQSDSITSETRSIAELIADGETPLLDPDASSDDSLLSHPLVDLSNLSIALVGGHETTYREVTEVLKQYGLKRCIHVPPHSIASNSRSQIKDKISNCDLVVTITSYVDHSVAKCVKQLKDAQMLAGGSIRVSCHGKSGLVREVLEYFGQSMQNSPMQNGSMQTSSAL